MNSPRVTKLAKSHYQGMYKSPGSKKNVLTEADSNNNESPSWRSVYKKRCFDEFKKSRSKLVNRFRSLDVNTKEGKTTKDYLEQELEKICLLEATTQPELKVSVDEATLIYKQIQEELIPTSFGEFSDEELIEILQQQEQMELMNQEAISNNNSPYIVCPICQKSNLIEQDTCIACTNPTGCVFKLTNADMSLNELLDRLENAIGRHQCNETPYFSFKNDIMPDSQEAIVHSQLSGNSRNYYLLMNCDKCNLMHYVF